MTDSDYKVFYTIWQIKGNGIYVPMPFILTSADCLLLSCPLGQKSSLLGRSGCKTFIRRI